MKDKYMEELDFCVDLWEKEGGCMFGGGTKCDQCATPYLLLKLLTGEVLHGDMKRLDKEDWRQKIADIKSKM